MAVSIGFCPTLRRSAISPTLQKELKLSPWRCTKGKRCEIQQLNDFHGNTSQISLGIKVNQRLLPRHLSLFAASEGQLSAAELGSDDLEQNNLLHAEEEDSSRIALSLPAQRAEGKPGFISFHGFSPKKEEEVVGSMQRTETTKLLWFIGPTVLVSFLVFPTLYLRRMFSAVFEDSLLTDFLILFFTEALFYGGVAIFVLLIDHVWKPRQQATPIPNLSSGTQYGLRVSSVATLVLSLLIPLVTMGMVWPWTGPAASATLAPYLVGLVVQFAFEQYARYLKSPAWPVIPIIFQVYRLHQLNRAAQLVTALSFSVRGTETTSQTLAINSSLGTLLAVLQILGIICVWSLASFLMRFLPASQAIPES